MRQPEISFDRMTHLVRDYRQFPRARHLVPRYADHRKWQSRHRIKQFLTLNEIVGNKLGLELASPRQDEGAEAAVEKDQRGLLVQLRRRRLITGEGELVRHHQALVKPLFQALRQSGPQKFPDAEQRQHVLRECIRVRLAESGFARTQVDGARKAVDDEREGADLRMVRAEARLCIATHLFPMAQLPIEHQQFPPQQPDCLLLLVHAQNTRSSGVEVKSAGGRSGRVSVRKAWKTVHMDARSASRWVSTASDAAI